MILRHVETILWLLLLSALTSTAVAQAPATMAPRVLLIVGDSTSVVTAKGARHFEQEHPAAAAAMPVKLVSEAHVGELRGQDLSSVRVLLFDSHSESRSGSQEQEFKVALIRSVAARGKVFALGQGAAPRSTLTAIGANYDDRVREYWGSTAESWRNVYGLLCLLAQAEFGQALAVPQPERVPNQGYYHPQAPAPHWFEDFDAYRAWHAKSGKLHIGQPWIAVPFYGSTLFQEQTGLLDAVIAEAEKQNFNVLPVFGYPEKKLWDDLLLDARGRARAQAALAFTFRFAGPEMQAPLSKADIPVFNLIKTYARSERDWRESKTGLSIFENVFQVAIPELSGLIAPIVVGTEERRFDPTLQADVVVAHALPERVTMAIKRLKRYLTLQTKPNAEKRLALVYYNYPPGKANIGASYLNTLRSVAVILQKLKAQGYDVGSGPLTEEEVTSRALNGGRNVGSYAPGELQALLDHGQVQRVPDARYRAWFDALPAQFRAQVHKDWGDPDASEGMWIANGSELEMIVPVAVYGKVAVLPQPDRGFGQALEKLYHSMDVTPPHHYAGVYRWLRDEWRADAVVHVGTHGTLEWLGGKTMGLTESDAPDVMIDELPDIYLYNVDVVGEGLVAKRRGMASIVDHMIPPLKKGGLYGEYAKISELASDYESAVHKSPNLAAGIEKELRERLRKLGLIKDLGLEDPSHAFTHADSHKIEDYFAELKNKNMPYGLHTFGVVPDAALRASTVEAIMEPQRDLGYARRSALANEMDHRMQASGAREIEQMLAALSGRYVAAGTGNDPVRNPDSLPTGKDFYGIDPSKVPKKAAWELGVKLADDMIAQHLEREGRYPQKVAFVIWGTETLRHEGVSESQFLHLLGTRPVWDERGKVIDVEVVPRAKLGWPRIDVVISSAADDMFGQLTELMDKAVQKVNLLEEPDNFAREHTLANAQRLKERGYEDKEALRRASIRIFDEPPGQYNLNVARIVQNSGTWNQETAIANDYFQKMGHGFGNGSWGENMEDAFRLALSGTEKIVHSRSSNLYGTLDNDDFFMYAGGLAQAVRTLDGKTPELMVAELQTIGSERMSPIARVMGMEFRNRSTNPQWIEGMMKEGYAGAHEMRAHLENLWGWQVTIPEAVGPEKWAESFETYVLDKNQLGLEAWFEQHSPFARQDMVARMLETVRKGRWSPSPEVRARLAAEYIKSAKAHGFSCSAFICQNPSLAAYTLDQGRAAGVSEADLKTFEAKLEQVTGKNLASAANEMKSFVSRTEQAHTARASKVQAGLAEAARQLQGFLMEKQSQLQEKTKPLAKSITDRREQLISALVAILLAVSAWGWMRRRVRRWQSGVSGVLLIVLCAMHATTAKAQRTDENAVKAAEDAFGVTIGRETLGLYTSTSVRGFSPTAAGNVRIDGLYFDQVWAPNSRLRRATTIRVGPSAQSYPFPAPTGIVDNALRIPGSERSLSMLVSADKWGGHSLEADGVVPLITDQLSIGLGAALFEDEYYDGSDARYRNAGASAHWTPTQSIEIVPFAARSEARDEEVGPVYVPGGNFLPPRMVRRRHDGPAWTDYAGTAINYGVVANYTPASDWRIRLGMFRSLLDDTSSYANLLTNLQPDGTAERVVVADPPSKLASTSGELRVTRSVSAGDWLHLLHASLRARERTNRYDGSDILLLGPTRIGERATEPRPALQFGEQTRDHITQRTLGLAYELRWARRAQLGLGIQRSSYEKRVERPLDDTRTRDEPWLYNVAGAYDFTEFLTAYFSYTRGLEESGVAPESAINRNEALAAIHTRQADAGIRYALSPSVKLLAGVFEVTKPYFTLDAANRFAALGDVTHRGLELSVSGSLGETLHVVAGAVLMDPEVTGPDVRSSLVGSKPVGQPQRTALLNVDWRPPGLHRVSVDLGVRHTTSVPATRDNLVELPARTLIDIGGRYRFAIGRVPATLRLSVTNVTDEYGYEIRGSGAYRVIPGRQATAYLTVDW